MTLSIRSITYQEHPKQPRASYNFSLDKAEFVGLVGTNGSGKSTLIKLLTGEYPLQSGDIKFNQISLTKQSIQFKKSLGYMPDKFTIDSLFSVKQFLHYVALCKQLSSDQIDIHVNQVIDDFNLTDLQNTKINRLSLGQQQKVNLAQALIGQPSLLVLDEPLNGLDPVAQQSFWQHLQRCESTHILMASHHLQELQQRCDRILIVNQHTIVANIDLQNTQFLIALKKNNLLPESKSSPTHNVISDSINGCLIGCNSSEEYEQLKQYHINELLDSGSTLDVLNQLFLLQANGEWQW